jgi:hypothetical protein
MNFSIKKAIFYAMALVNFEFRTQFTCFENYHKTVINVNPEGNN